MNDKTERTTIVSVPLPMTLAQRLRDRARANDRHLLDHNCRSVASMQITAPRSRH